MTKSNEILADTISPQIEQQHGKLPDREITTAMDTVSGVLTVTFAPDAARRIAEALHGIEFPSEGDENAHISLLRRVAYTCMPVDALHVLDAVRNGQLTPTALVCNGLRSDRVASSPAPGEAFRKRKPTDLSENTLVMFGALLGEPYGMAGEGKRLVNDLIPNQEEALMLTGNGSELRLGFHTENAAHRWLYPDRDLSPQGLLLSGICVPDCDPPLTRIANGRLAARKLALESPALYDRLWKSCTRLALPLRQRKPDRSRLAPSPILSGGAGSETVTAAYYGDMMERLDPEAIAAFESALDKCATGLLIGPGVIAYIPNSYCLHSRDAFIAKFDAEGRANRWLQRIFITARLDSFSVCEAVSDRRFELTTK